MMSLNQIRAWIAQAQPSVRLFGDGSLMVRRVHTDTRSIAEGDLFLALKGEQFDANQFLATAKGNGALAAVAHSGLSDAGLPGVEVADTKLALGAVAGGWRNQFDVPLIAVSGSNGKTTVTQMVASILQCWKGSAALATKGNLNNDIGLPLTLLRLDSAHRAAVVELGMNHPGEIAYLASLARPTVALVNNAQREHLEFMESVEAVARENGSSIESLGEGGVAVFPSDDEFTPLWRSLAKARQTFTFSTSAEADVTCSAEWQKNGWMVIASTPNGMINYVLHVPGRHNLKNSLAAVACCLAIEVPMDAISEGLSLFAAVKGRSSFETLAIKGHSVVVVDDTYNANPDSMRAAVDVLAGLPPPRLLVLGDMGEVGLDGPQFHAEVGELSLQSGIDKVFTFGDQASIAASSFGAGQHFSDINDLADAVLSEAPKLGSILVKGSRFMKMERVVCALRVAAHSAPKEDGSDAA